MQATPTAIPRVPADIDAAWLSCVLHTPVASVEQRDIGEGVGNASIVTALRLAYEGVAELPQRMVAKLRHPRTADRAVAYGYNLRETAFYRDAAPALPNGLVPRCHFEACDPAGDPFVMLLDHVDGRSLNLADGCTADESAAFLTSLALLHGCLRGSSRLDAWPWLAGFDRSFAQLVRLLPDMVPRFVERMSGQCDPRTLRMMTEMAPLWGRYLAHCARRADAGVAMFDSKIDNGIYVRHAGAAAAPQERVVLIDFALASRSTGAWDVVNCLTGLTVEMRARHEAELLRHYVDARDGTATQEARDRFLRDFEEGLLVQLVFTTLVAATPISDPRIARTTTALIERAIAASEGHDLRGAVARWKAI